MLGERVDGPYGFASKPLTASGPAPYGLGRPARIGEDRFPGPSSSKVASNSTRGPVAHARTSSSATATAPTPARQVVEVPSASPPRPEVMSSGASTDEVEAELTRLLEGMQGTLNAAREVVGGLEWRGWKGGEKERERQGEGDGEGEGSEWEDEE